MLKRSVLLSSLLTCSCQSLTEVYVPPEQEAEPEFLGRFSGVYAGVGGSEDAYGRMILIQLGGKVLFSPFMHQPGEEPALSIFANIAEFEDTGAPAQPFGASAGVDPYVQLVMGMDMLGQDAENCFAETTEDPYPSTLAEYGAFWSACGNPCAIPCIMPDYFNPDGEGWENGACLDEKYCAYDLMIGGQVSDSAVDLYFGSSSLSPEAGYNETECPAGQGWNRCIRYPKLCDFDSRYAGVYRTTLTLDTEASTGSSPPDIDTEPEIAVAVARNLDAIILFDGDRFLLGPLDRFDYSFSAANGDPVDDSGSIKFMREEAFVSELEGKLVEDPDAGVVNLTGTFTITTDPGEASAAEYSYTVSGSRASGVEVGTACGPLGECKTNPILCPLGNQSWSNSELITEFDVDDSGCPRSECRRRITPDGLCDDAVFDCGGAFSDGQFRYEELVISVQCSDGADTCPDWDQCVEIRCPTVEDDPELLTRAEVDQNCGTRESGVVLSFGGRTDGIRFECNESAMSCPNNPPRCALGYSWDIRSELEPRVDDSGCIDFDCTQYLNPRAVDEGGDICADAVVPTCSGGEAPFPAIRQVEDDRDCIEYVCGPSCVPQCEQWGCWECADPVMPDCGDQWVRVSDQCGCLRFDCGGPTCETKPSACPLGNGYMRYDMLTYVNNEGCVELDCDQIYIENNICWGVDPAVDPGALSCDAGYTPMPHVRQDENCLEYQCRPSCTEQCDGCDACFDPVIDDAACFATGRQVRAHYNHCGCVLLSCEQPTCDVQSTPCPLGNDYHGFDMRAQTDYDGCINLDCDQVYTGNNLCWDVDPAVDPGALSCDTGYTPMPWVRSYDSCLEYQCRPTCTDMDPCPDCGACNDPVIDDGACFARGWQIRASFNYCGCVELTCEQPVCEQPPTRCPLGYEYPANDMQTSFDNEGCIDLECRQIYTDTDLCPGVDPAVAPGALSCGTGLAPMPYPRPGWGGCLEYQCRPTCSDTDPCPGCGACNDPVIDDDACFTGGGQIRASFNYCGCVELSCF